MFIVDEQVVILPKVSKDEGFGSQQIVLELELFAVPRDGYSFETVTQYLAELTRYLPVPVALPAVAGTINSQGE